MQITQGRRKNETFAWTRLVFFIKNLFTYMKKPAVCLHILFVCLLTGHPRFPKGLQIGFYYNVCTDKTWYDTELRGPKNVCCKTRTKKFAGCPDDSEK